MEHEETRAIWRRRGRAAERGHDRDEETSRPTSRERFIVVQISRDAHMSEAHNRLKSAVTPRTKNQVVGRAIVGVIANATRIGGAECARSGRRLSISSLDCLDADH